MARESGAVPGVALSRVTLLALLLVALLAAVFFWPREGRNWRLDQAKLLRSAENLRREHAPAASARGPLEGRAELEGLSRLIRERELELRLTRLADSLQALRSELDQYDQVLLTVRDRVRDLPAAGDQQLEVPYFSGVRAVYGARDELENLSVELEELRRSIEAVPAVPAAGKGGEDDRSERLEAGRIRWLTPERVAVREACTTCHLPIGQARVLLRPNGAETAAYPEPMLRHATEQFGCTVCHHGEAGSVRFTRAHGDDAVGRAFRGEALAVRSCGSCHSAGRAVAWREETRAWQESCSGCHGVQPKAFQDENRRGVRGGKAAARGNGPALLAGPPLGRAYRPPAGTRGTGRDHRPAVGLRRGLPRPDCPGSARA